ncbi:MAG: alpha-2-macroglobulin, partial [Gallionellaceae bacterium]|nr:alpha-2-macroglobulin [Gallionellaceae bacterium]
MRKLQIGVLFGLLLFGAELGMAQAPATAPVAKVESFTPQGEIKGVRQVAARFSVPMVTFGDPRPAPPFDVQCDAPGHGRWSDARNWIYDFDNDLPAGLKCAFTTKPKLRSIGGGLVQPASFNFNTGGPALVMSYPGEGSWNIDEQQIFLLGLDAQATPDSIKEHAFCNVEGIGERIPLEVLEGSERDKVITEQSDRARNMFLVLTKRGRAGLLAVKDNRLKDAPIVVARCGRALPSGSKVSIVWGKGIAAANGLATSQDQRYNFGVRDNFSARTTCERVNPKAGCIPVTPLTLAFSAPVDFKLADKIRLQTANGEMSPLWEKKNGQSPTVDNVTFPGPFPANTEVTLTLPSNFVDDAGRPLTNAASFPLKIRIDEDPPLIKFPSKFGILELNADPALPVTVRNVEPTLKGVQTTNGSGKGVLARMNGSDDGALAKWILHLTAPAWERGEEREGEFPILMKGAAGNQFDISPLELPRNNDGKPFEVMGIPLPKPGFYMIEFASNRLGAALNGDATPYYVSSGALVTNMAVHFKKGRESSLVWVTTLDNAKPVSGAAVRISTCYGDKEWEGTTDANGTAHVNVELGDISTDKCSGHLVTARKDGDLSFVLSTWDDGINPWQFNLGGGEIAGPVIAHTVFDRPLFRAGETVSMKHFIRFRTEKGFDLVNNMPSSVTITHAGSGDEYTVPVEWSRNGSSGVSTWKIPQEAKLGTYWVTLKGYGRYSLESGTFRVEQYRVPLMKATLKPPAPLVNGDKLSIDAQLNLLAGGAAAGAPVKFRSRLVPYTLQFADYDDFSFGGRIPKLGISAVQPYAYDPDEDEGDDEGGDADDTSSNSSGDGNANQVN